MAHDAVQAERPEGELEKRPGGLGRLTLALMCRARDETDLALLVLDADPLERDVGDHLTTVAGHLTVFLVLLVSLRTLDVSASEVSAVEAFAAWALVRLLGSIPIPPGGLGVVELGLTTALVGFGGNQVEVVAAVLVYRFLTIVPTLVIGLAAGATWKRYRPHHLPAQDVP